MRRRSRWRASWGRCRRSVANGGSSWPRCRSLAAAQRASSEMLEFLSELFNAANREGDYCQTLLKLFDVYCDTGDFAKAAECLDRAAEVDPYEPGHAKRLDILKSKIDENKFKEIASRFTSTSPTAAQKAIEHEATLGASTLQDLDAAGGNPGAVRHAQQSDGAACSGYRNFFRGKKSAMKICSDSIWQRE